jgi:ABC-type Co2+ transport system permease subunit
MKIKYFLTVSVLTVAIFPAFSFAIDCPSGTVPNATKTGCEAIQKIDA